LNVLFYGGCHAYVLKNTFNAFAPNGHSFDCLINFDLIRANEPFPWAKMKNFDAIVFSPIQHEDYKTELLKKFCDDHGIKHIAYPWMQWNGYFPAVKKGDFLGGVSWQYPDLYGPKAKPPEKRFILDNLDQSDEILRNFEKRHDVDVVISYFVRNNYRKRRLFLTPDHPTAFMYRYLVREIAEKLGIKLDASYWLSAYEPQAGIKLPIRPGVAEALELDFVDADFENSTAFGNMTLPWSGYVQLYELKGGRVLEAKAATIIKGRPVARAELAPSEFTSVRAGDIIVFEEDSKKSLDGHWHGSVLLGRSTLYSKMSSHRGYLYKDHWREKKVGLI